MQSQGAQNLKKEAENKEGKGVADPSGVYKMPKFKQNSDRDPRKEGRDGQASLILTQVLHDDCSASSARCAYFQLKRLATLMNLKISIYALLTLKNRRQSTATKKSGTK